MPRPKEFRPEDKIKMLLWSDRHCCLCGKQCGPDIEIGHIDKNAGNDIGNGIPLCYDCHAKVDRYSLDSFQGNRYRTKELKLRRDQVYEKYTRDLVPPILLTVTTEKTPNQRALRRLPYVATIVEHRLGSLPVRIKVEAKTIIGDFNNARDKGLVDDPSGYYNGKAIWNMNPYTIFYGGFGMNKELAKKGSAEGLMIETRITVIDQFEREHKFLPQCWRYVKHGESEFWNLEPRQFTEWT